MNKYAELEDINDMIIDDNKNYLLAGTNGLIEVHERQRHHHLKGDRI